MSVGAIFPIGTSVGGCPEAIAEILKDESALEIHILYGNRGAPDAADPMDVAKQIKASVGDPRVTWVGCQAVEPFNMSETYAQVRSFVAEIADRNYDRVYVGITGATNPVVTSLFQTAMAYLSCHVIPVYVQARGAVRVQHFVASDVRDRVSAEKALATARSGQVRVAARLAERLPSDGQWKFLSSSLVALADWDDFDYLQARHTLEHQARKSGEYAQDSLLAHLADTVARLAANASQMSNFVKKIRDQQDFDATATNAGWEQRVSENGLLLVADTLANAQRRINEGRFTDSVLRSYRAAECATQMRLFAIGIHPSRPDACQTAFKQYHRANETGSGQLAFKAGLQFLENAGKISLAPVQEYVRNLGNTRNHTYLEHGYDRVQKGRAQRCFEWSQAICQHLLGPDIAQAWQGFQMRF